MASEKEKLIAKSGLIGLVGQVITLLISIITTRLFIHCLGVEIRGVYGVLANCMSYLQLSELGVGSAITYHLYKPIKENSQNEICEWVHLYKVVLRIIAVVILVLGIIMSLFLPRIVKETTLSDEKICCYFSLILLSTLCTYFGAHKKCLMYADQKQYLLSAIEIVTNVIASAVQIIILMKFKSFVGFLLLQALKNLGNSILTIYMANSLYGFINQKCSFDKEKFRELVSNVKYIFMGEISTVIYLSTDNLIVSSVVGVAAVGYLTNYVQLKSVLKGFVVGVTAPIKPVLAEIAQNPKDKDRVNDSLKKYNFFRFMIANLSVVGFVGVSNAIINVWIGEQYILGMPIIILLAIDLYIDIVNSSLCDVISIYGLFRQDKNIALTGAITNALFSLMMVFRFGVEGVLIGTVIAQLYYWGARVYVTYKHIDIGGCRDYIIENVGYIVITTFEIVIILFWRENMMLEGGFGDVLLLALIVVVFSAVCLIAFYGRKEEFKYFLKKGKEMFRS